MKQVTVGHYLAQRLEEVGIRDYFAIPGEFNLSLVGELLKNPRLPGKTMVSQGRFNLNSRLY